ncbi:MAG: redoxin domain-containing protein [Spirochaetia bacterium]|nr:redoxin domain-containing protein [Spirochaetia bacterium]
MRQTFLFLFISAVLGGMLYSQSQEAPKILKPAERGVGRLIPDLAFTTLDGKPHRLSEYKTSSLLVIAFTSTTCPVAKKYAPTLAAIEKDFEGKNVVVIRIDTSSAENRSKAEESAGESKSRYAFDPARKFASSLGAVTTTEIFVLDAKRTLIYRGAVDDQYGLGYSLAAPKQNYLRDALAAGLAGKLPIIRATSAPGCILETRGAVIPEKVPLTYHERVSRIIHDNCQSCHRVGGVGPFALETLAQVESESGMIKKVVSEGRMPPWFAAPNSAGSNANTPWINDRALTTEDKADLLKWLAGSKPAGPSNEALIARVESSQWEMGEPQTVFQIPEPITVKATGVMAYQHMFVKTSFHETRWVNAWEVRPTAREVVHHVLVFAIPKEEADDENLRKRAARGESGGFFAAFVPGNSSLVYPEGFAKELTPGAVLYFQIHYTPNGKATEDQTRLGLSFSKEPPRYRVQVAGVANRNIRIPPGEANHPETAELTVPYDVKIMGFVPHMHLRGKAFSFVAENAGGAKEKLLEVPNYDFNWQLDYRYAEPKLLTAGTKLVATAWYDNSAANPANPDPTKTVKWGSQTDSEMMIGYVEYYLPNTTNLDAKPPLVNTPSPQDILKLFDKNQDGRVSREELESSPRGKSYARYFDNIDANRDGFLDPKEIDTAIQLIGKRPR